MHHSRTRLILEFLAEGGWVMLDSLYPKNYPQSQLARDLLGLDTRRTSKEKTKRSLSSILSRLKREGLAERHGSKKYAKWTITPKGKRHVKEVTPRIFPSVRILPASDGILRLVAFDIPETERKKRDWIRKELIGCGYTMLQKSVFVGYRPLPHDFVEQLDMLGLDKKVHIMSIEKKGTLRAST